MMAVRGAQRAWRAAGAAVIVLAGPSGARPEQCAPSPNERTLSSATVDALWNQPGARGPNVTVQPVKRHLITLPPGADWRKLAAEAGLADAQVFSAPELGAGTVLSVAMHPDAWPAFEAKYCGVGNPYGIAACESDFCQEFQLPTVPQGSPAPAETSSGERAHHGQVRDPAGRPVAGATVTADELPPPVESILDTIEEVAAGTVEDILSKLEQPRPDPWDPSPPVLTTTGPNGMYTLPLPALKHSWEVVVGAGWEQASAPLTGPTMVADHGPGTTPRPPDDDKGDGGTTTPDDGDDDDPRDAEEPLLGILLVRDDDTWMPQFGNQTKVTAQIYQRDPLTMLWRISGRKRPITVAFTARSKEPGRCLNADLPSDPQDSPDLFFPAAENSHSTCSEGEGRSYLHGRCTTKEPVSRQQFVVGSQDFGSYGTLRASCPGCLPLERPPDLFRTAGTLPELALDSRVNSPNHLVLLPKDDNGNQIADYWAWDRIRPSKATDDDDEHPMGNGVKGDGLSAYEEYRGFLAKGSHKRTRLKNKTLFVVNEPGFPTQLFKDASELEVYEVDTNELGGWSAEGIGRSINFNSGHANVVNQHGLRLTETIVPVYGLAWTGPVDLLVSAITSKLGPPKYIEWVGVNRPSHARFGARAAEELEATVAHELGHAVGMPHHGNWITNSYDAEQDPSLQGDDVSHVTDDIRTPRPYLCGQKLPAVLEIGTKGDQASGREECIMRYTQWAHAYFETDGRINCLKKEPSQTMFCDSPAGVDFNKAGRFAGSASNGDCKHRIQVNDVF